MNNFLDSIAKRDTIIRIFRKRKSKICNVPHYDQSGYQNGWQENDEHLRNRILEFNKKVTIRPVIKRGDK